MVFGVRSIRVFSKFSLDPYYEPLLWFMIQAMELVYKFPVNRTIYKRVVCLSNFICKLQFI